MKKLLSVLAIMCIFSFWTTSDAQMQGNMMADSTHMSGIKNMQMHPGAMNGNLMGNGMGNGMGNNMGFNMGNNMGFNMGNNMGFNMGNNMGLNMGNEMTWGMGNGMHDMMYGMMNNIRNMMSSASLLRQYVWIANWLPEMQNELSLTDDQVTKLIDLQTIMVKHNADLKAELTKKELMLKSLLDKNASSKDVGDQLKSCDASRIDIAVSTYETANKMKGVLNESQLKQLEEKWKNYIAAMSILMNN